MAILQAKTPDALFKRMKVTEIGDQQRANETGRPKTSFAQHVYDPNGDIYKTDKGDLYHLEGESDEYLRKVLGPGQRRKIVPGKKYLPEQWKFKTGSDLAAMMTKTENNPVLKKAMINRYGKAQAGFEGDPTANTTSDEYREYLMNEKGWDKSTADRQVNLFYPSKK